MSQIDRRQALKLLAALGLAAVAGPTAAGCGSATGKRIPDTPVRIGVLVPRSGPYRAVGDELTNGFLLYLKLSENRIGGHTAELVFADEGATVDSGRAAVDELIRQDVLAIGGGHSSAVLAAVAGAVQAARIPLLACGGSPSRLPDSTFVWRASYVDGEFGTALGRYVGERYRAPGETVYLVGPDTAAGKEILDAFRGAYSATNSARLAGAETTPGGPADTLDFRAAVGRIGASAAKVVFCAYTGPAGVAFLEQYREILGDKAPPLYAPGPLTEGAALAEAGPAARGVYTAMNYAAGLDSIANRGFVTEYRDEYGRAPSAPAMAAYDAAVVLSEAISEAGADLTPVTLNTQLGLVGTVDGPRGAWRFNADRAPLQRWYLRQVRPDGDGFTNDVVAELPALG